MAEFYTGAKTAASFISAAFNVSGDNPDSHWNVYAVPEIGILSDYAYVTPYENLAALEYIEDFNAQPQAYGFETGDNYAELCDTTPAPRAEHVEQSNLCLDNISHSYLSGYAGLSLEGVYDLSDSGARDKTHKHELIIRGLAGVQEGIAFTPYGVQDGRQAEPFFHGLIEESVRNYNDDKSLDWGYRYGGQVYKDNFGETADIYASYFEKWDSLNIDEAGIYISAGSENGQSYQCGSAYIRDAIDRQGIFNAVAAARVCKSDNHFIDTTSISFSATYKDTGLGLGVSYYPEYNEYTLNFGVALPYDLAKSMKF